jgi:hypothetical protein
MLQHKENKMNLLRTKTRRREAAVAKAMTEMLLANCVTGQPIPKETFAHFFGLACEQHKFTPDAKSCGRILGSVEKAVAKLERNTGRLIKQINKSTEQLEALR